LHKSSWLFSEPHSHNAFEQLKASQAAAPRSQAHSSTLQDSTVQATCGIGSAVPAAAAAPAAASQQGLFHA
jgi:hypothetical protein